MQGFGNPFTAEAGGYPGYHGGSRLRSNHVQHRSLKGVRAAAGDGPGVKKGENLHIRSTFADIAKTTAEYLGVQNELCGDSFLKQILL
jgi:hypothetical protein